MKTSDENLLPAPGDLWTDTSDGEIVLVTHMFNDLRKDRVWCIIVNVGRYRKIDHQFDIAIRVLEKKKKSWALVARLD